MRERLSLEEFKEREGLAEEDRERLETTKVITFWQNEDGNTMSRLPSGGVVFPHRQWADIIVPGETWLSELEQRGTTFFAKGIKKIDSAFFLDLRSDQMDEVAKALWEQNRELLEPMLEEKYQHVMEKAIEERAAESKRIADETQTKLAEREAELTQLKQMHKLTVTALEREIRDREEREKSDTDTPAPPMFSDGFSPRAPKIRRIEPDVLESKDFTSVHYFVHVSPDRSVMTIRPHEQGNVACSNNRLELSGLSLILPYGGPGNIPAEYSAKYGGYVAHLRYTPSDKMMSEEVGEDKEESASASTSDGEE
ncbi:MAG: hypothetical protein CVT48_02940 [Thermoplasmata archaeon HGW-Thermoplasmata-1]|nr:MAG: hypothetical protein CVT48_02940 [Thermoplasmata archaeon HGW-Thermoplasmata-1]